MAERSVLVVDDRVEARALVAGELEEAGFRVEQAADGEDAWSVFRRRRPDLVVSDLRMPRADGIELVRRIRRVSAVPVLLISAYGDVPAAVAAIKAGAQEFLAFPDDLDGLIPRARRLLASAPESRGDELERRLAGRSAAMRRVRERVAALAPLSVPVLVQGESGTGRDRVVGVLHELGAGSDAPLVAVRAEGGSAVHPRSRSRGAAVYLDEVDRFEVREQGRWLEALRTAPPGVARLYASTSADLDRQAREGRFLPELAERLARFTIVLPPLRQRQGDVPQLVAALVAEIGAALGREDCRVQPAALAQLRSRRWPGNVRELAAVLEKLVAFSPEGEISGERARALLHELPEGVESLRRQRETHQREELVRLLEECGGNLAEVARRLGLSRGAIIYRARKYGLLDPAPG